jgi:mRNA interferase MazF
VAVPKGVSGLQRGSDVLVDQIKSIDNRRLRRKVGALPDPYLGELRQKLLMILDFVEESLSGGSRS